MDNKLLSTPTPGGTRNPLAEALPLDTPYMIQIFPAYACNFRCSYCIYALDKSSHGYISDKTFMDWDLYVKCIDEVKLFPRKLKMLRFAGIGEPLLHPQIAQMIDYAIKSNVADSVDIVTNASLLTKELSDALITAKPGRLRISLEGLSDVDYKRNCNSNINFEKLVENISYFFHNTKNTHVYIKIIDYMVKDEDKKELFFDTFSPICHSMAIEHLTPTIKEIDYSSLNNSLNLNTAQNGQKLLDTNICPQSFYMMQINPDGKVVPCCSMKYPAILGDINSETVTALWSGNDYNNFRMLMLDGSKSNSVCAECTLYRYDLHKEDLLDEKKEKLKVKYMDIIKQIG